MVTLSCKIQTLFGLSEDVTVLAKGYNMHYNDTTRLYSSSSMGIFSYNITKWPAVSWLGSTVGRTLHQYRRGHGFESRSGLNFFSGLNFTTV